MRYQRYHGGNTVPLARYRGTSCNLDLVYYYILTTRESQEEHTRKPLKNLVISRLPGQIPGSLFLFFSDRQEKGRPGYQPDRLSFVQSTLQVNTSDVTSISTHLRAVVRFSRKNRHCRVRRSLVFFVPIIIAKPSEKSRGSPLQIAYGQRNVTHYHSNLCIIKKVD